MKAICVPSAENRGLASLFVLVVQPHSEVGAPAGVMAPLPSIVKSSRETGRAEGRWAKRRPSRR